MDTQDHDGQLTEMRRELAELRSEVTRLRERPDGGGGDGALGATSDESRSRRQLFRGAAAAGAGLAVATIASRPAAADDGQAILIGQANTGMSNTSLSTTAMEGLKVTATDTGPNGNVGVKGTAASFFGVGVEGRNDRPDGTTAGVRGSSLSPSGFGVLGLAGAGIGVLGIAEQPGGFGAQFRSPRAALFIQSSGTEAPPLLDDPHFAGEIQLDDEQNLWACVGSGTPGAWRLLAGPGSAGATVVVDPFRVFDTRATDGPILLSESLIISMKDSIDVDTGELVKADALPVGATSIFYNITITNTVNEGFLSVTPGDADTFGASSVNWTTSGSTVANGSLVKLDDDRRIKVFAGGVPGSATDFIIDVTGYTI